MGSRRTAAPKARGGDAAAGGRLGERTLCRRHEWAGGAGKGAACAGVRCSHPPPLLRRAGSLEERIAAGEFTDAGSTKERLTRPLRRILAKDPIGPGAWPVVGACCGTSERSEVLAGQVG